VVSDEADHNANVKTLTKLAESDRIASVSDFENPVPNSTLVLGGPLLPSTLWPCPAAIRSGFQRLWMRWRAGI
jgi:hypothetical protein